MKRLLIYLLAALSVFTGSTLAAERPPNIIYLLVDDLGRADCGFMGGKDIRTPHIDKLARGGAILDSFYVQPVCSPTRAALLTGRYATHTGVYTVVRPGAPWGLPLAERTLPQALREAGYATFICGKWHLGEFQPAYTPTRRGFDHQYGHMFGALDYFTHQRDGKHDWYRDDKSSVEEGYSTHLLAKEACRIIRDQPVGRPLFLYVPFNGVHAPHQVPDSYKQPYQDLKEPRRTIAGMLASVDEAIGQITAALDEKGLRQNTLIIFSSDNGGPNPGRATMNTPLRAGKGTIYEGGIRACAFANWPGKISPNTTNQEPMHAVDWYPTLLKLAGAPTKQKLAPDGLDLWPALTQGAKSPHDAILLHGTTPGKAAVRMGDWKLLLNASLADTEEGPGGEAKPAGAVELYNLADDIGETKNLAASQPAKVKELRARLDAFLKDAVAPGNAVAKPAARRVEGDTLFFTGASKATATAQLLRVPSALPQIASANGAMEFEAGRDFIWQSGTRAVTLTAESRIPFKTTDELHPPANSPNAYKSQRGTDRWMFFGPGHVIHDLQCVASYASKDDWRVPLPAAAPDEQLGGLRAKLRAKQPVKCVMLGDSISTEADASALANVWPHQAGYPRLVARALESRFGAKVALTNLSKGGMDSKWGVTRVPDVLAEKPDLLLIAFGMNDASGRRTAEEFARVTRQIIEPVRAVFPDCAVILVSSMTANSEWIHSAPELYPAYATALAQLTGPGLALADVTSVWTAVETRKKHFDLTGNGLNHPNDFGHRLYAETILAVIGGGKAE